MIFEDILSGSFILLLTFIISFFISKKIHVSISYCILIVLWHTAFSYYYYRYSLSSIADSTMYYQVSKSQYFEYKFSGTDNVIIFTRFFSEYLDFSYLNTFLVFNILGSIALLIFASVLLKTTNSSSTFIRLLSIIIIFLPSASFWSSSIGKDVFSFLSATLFLIAIKDKKINYRLIAMAVIIMFLVRPHISLIQVLAIAFHSLTGVRVSITKKLIAFLLFSTLIAISAPFIIKYVGLGDNTSAAEVLNYIETRQQYNQTGGGAIDISSMSLIEQIFAYVYRPLPFEANNLLSLAASLENTIFLLITILAIYLKYVKKIKIQSRSKTFIFYIILCLLILAPTTANLGISLRQKWMFMPMLLIVIFETLSKKNHRYVL